jgi:hypothetical protein
VEQQRETLQRIVTRARTSSAAARSDPIARNASVEGHTATCALGVLRGGLIGVPVSVLGSAWEAPARAGEIAPPRTPTEGLGRGLARPELKRFGYRT